MHGILCIDVDELKTPRDIHPLGRVPGPLIGLDVGIIGLGLGLEGHGIGGNGERLAVRRGHIDLDAVLGRAVGPIAAFLIDLHPEGGLLAAAGVVVGIEGFVLFRHIGVQRKDELVIFIAGRESLHAAAHPDALNGDAFHGLSADLHGVAEEVGHAGAGPAAEGDCQVGAVHALHRVPQHQIVAHGVHPQLVGGELLAVDGDGRTVGHLHQLTETQGHGDPLAGVVGSLRSGDAVEHRYRVVVEQFHSAVLHRGSAAVGIGRGAVMGKRVFKEETVGDGVALGTPALEPECRRDVVAHLRCAGPVLPLQGHFTLGKPDGIVLAGVAAVDRQIPAILTDVGSTGEIRHLAKAKAGVASLHQFAGHLELDRVDLIDGHRVSRCVLKAVLQQLAQGVHLADPGAVRVQEIESCLCPLVAIGGSVV